MIKVIVTKKAYYNNMLLKPNDVVIINDDILPSWAVIIKDTEQQPQKILKNKKYSKKNKCL